jgi:hypothetical protein
MGDNFEKVAGTSETLANFYETTLHNIPESNHLILITTRT